MKFSDGYWAIREGVRAAYPIEVHEVDIDEATLIVVAATKELVHRGLTLNTPIVTIQCRAPIDDVIAVRMVHHAGERPTSPNFELAEMLTHPTIEDGSDAVSFTSGALKLTIDRGTRFAMHFSAAGRALTSSKHRAMAIIDSDDNRHYLREQLALGVGDQVYGLGERFGPFVKNGQTVDIWNADGGTSSEQAYKNIPFYLTSAGYGVFVNHPGRVSFEVASEVVSRTQFSVEGNSLEYFLIYGPTPAQVLQKYTALTGLPALPPAWSFGLWLSTSFTTSYDEETVNSFVDGMAARGLPLSVFHFDSFWMREFHWCDFEWDPRAFPDPAGMLKRLKAKGLRVCVWINPYIAQRSKLFAEGAERGFLLKRPNGDVWQWDRWQAGMALVDFTNPDACAWFADKLRALLDMGVDCFKTDFGERIPTDVAYFDGSDPERMHNYYPLLYNRTVFELLQKERGVGDAVVFGRSATAGGQQFPVHWGGDSTSAFESMAESLRGGLSLALSGFGFWSHDIGGFEGTPDPAIFKRWIPFGLLSSHSRLHGNESYRVPWTVDEESVDVLRTFTNLKMRLMPYLYDAAVTAHEHGVPMMRPMVLEFPDDLGCRNLDRQYMLGARILVAPVFSAEGETPYYLPAGRWTHLQTGVVVDGGRWVHDRCDFLSIPVYVRPNTVLATGTHDDRPDYTYADGVTLNVYELEVGVEVVTNVPTASGDSAATFITTRWPEGIEVRRSAVSAPAPWNIRLVGSTGVGGVSAGSTTIEAHGVLISLAADTDRCRITDPATRG
jgi:alpha-D-xyloside xylohydrolase